MYEQVYNINNAFYMKVGDGVTPFTMLEVPESVKLLRFSEARRFQRCDGVSTGLVKQVKYLLVYTPNYPLGLLCERLSLLHITLSEAHVWLRQRCHLWRPSLLR
jgi:hypothetical protein